MIIALIAGEFSGDLLGADLIRALKKHYPDARFVGVGGEKMQAEGLQTWFALEDLAVMGIVDVIKKLPALLKIRRQLFTWIKQVKPDVMIGIDAPDFNLGLEKKLKAAGIKTVHYVSPSVWAWRQGRLSSIKKSIDLMLTLFPFEAAFYQKNKIPVQYVGHPLADQIDFTEETTSLRQQWGYSSEETVMALLPGSRGGELQHIAPELIKAAKIIHQQRPDVQFITPFVNGHRRAQFENLLMNILGADLSGLSWKRVEGQAHAVMGLSDVVVLASGTATLEALLLKKPMVVVYKWAELTHKIISPFVKAKFIALPNLLADRLLVPELIQENCTAEKIAAAALQQLIREDKKTLIESFTNIHRQLRLDASAQAAKAITKVCEL